MSKNLFLKDCILSFSENVSKTLTIDFSKNQDNIEINSSEAKEMLSFLLQFIYGQEKCNIIQIPTPVQKIKIDLILEENQNV